MIQDNPPTATPFRIAVAQIDPHRGDLDYNRQLILTRLEEAAQSGAQLVVFPECALSGYVFESAEEAMPFAETVPGKSTEILIDACRRLNIHAVVGLLEREGETLYNSAFVTGPNGLILNYRKCHLPFLGIDRYVAQGDDLPVIDLPFARIGILICYDMRFPEATRSLALRGIDVLIIPTNWPEGAESSPEFLTRARAWENRIFVVACNRVGVEQGIPFIGRSQVVSLDGRFMAEADGESETLLFADIDPALARQKRIIIRPGAFEIDPINGRRPDLYGDLERPAS